MVVTGYDDRHGCGYVLSTGRDAVGPSPGTQRITHLGVSVNATPELAWALHDALANRPTVRLAPGGPEVPLTFDDRTLLGWLRHVVGGVLTVSGGPR